MITMTKPIDSSRKSDRKLKTEDGNPKVRSQRNLSKVVRYGYRLQMIKDYSTGCTSMP